MPFSLKQVSVAALVALFLSGCPGDLRIDTSPLPDDAGQVELDGGVVQPPDAGDADAGPANACQGQTCSGRGVCAIVPASAQTICVCEEGFRAVGLSCRSVVEAPDGGGLVPVLPANGIAPVQTPIADGGGQGPPDVVADGLGGFIVGWNEETPDGGLEFHAQRFGADLSPRWGASGVTWPRRFLGTGLTSDGVGGLLFRTQAPGAQFNGPLQYQRIDPTGAFAWGQGVQLLGPGINSGTLVPDGTGAFYAHANRELTKLDGSGARLWSRGNALLFNPTGAISDPILLGTGAGVWAFTTNAVGVLQGNWADAWLQRFDPSGAAQLGAGITITSTNMGQAAGFETAQAVYAEPAGGVLAVWKWQARAQASEPIEWRAQRFTSAGAPVWPTHAIAAQPPEPNVNGAGLVVSAAHPDGGVVVAFSAARFGDTDIALSGLDGAGNPRFGGTPAFVVQQQFAQAPERLDVLADGSIVLVWADSRGATTSTSTCGNDPSGIGGEDLWVQRFTPDGQPLLPGGGLPLGRENGRQRKARTALISGNRLVVVWMTTAERCSASGWGAVRVQVLQL